MTARQIHILTSLVLATALAPLARGQTCAFTYQGELTLNGSPANGSYDFQFRLSSAASGPGNLGPQLTQSGVTVANGLLMVQLDFGCAAWNSCQRRWLEIDVRQGAAAYVTLTPRTEVTPTPYAIDAQASCTGGGSGWSLTGNPGTSPSVNFIGTTDNEPLNLKVNNTTALQLQPGVTLPNIVGGLGAIIPSVLANNVSGVVIAGGNAPSGGVTGLGGGDFMAAYDNDGTIGGGFGNKVGTDNGDTTDAAFATVAGGVFNGAAGYAATVAGGDGNLSAGSRSFVGGGFGNQAIGDFSTLGGGLGNWSSGLYSTIGGGSNNVCSAEYATVPGGSENAAAGRLSFAAGHRALATNNGAFVWADSQNTAFTSTADDQFSVRARGGVQLNTDTSLFFGYQTRQMLNLWGGLYGIGVQSYRVYFRADAGGGFAWFTGGSHSDVMDNPGAGGSEMMRLNSSGLTVNGTFVSASDRNQKENFQPVDASEVLAKVAALPLTKWNYKEDSGSTHIGPMAQDFYAAFGVGPDDKHIATVDADGVALAAIQGLNQKLQEKLQQKEAAIEALERRLERLEAMLPAAQGETSH